METRHRRGKRQWTSRHRDRSSDSLDVSAPRTERRYRRLIAQAHEFVQRSSPLLDIGHRTTRTDRRSSPSFALANQASIPSPSQPLAICQTTKSRPPLKKGNRPARLVANDRMTFRSSMPTEFRDELFSLTDSA